MKKSLGALILTLALCPPAWAHSLWVNAFASFAHPPGHALITLGFGHLAPLDDLLSGAFGSIRLDRYEVIPPDGKAIALPHPDVSRQAAKPVAPGLSLSQGDLGINKLQFAKEAAKGTYQVTAVSAPAFFTQYQDKSGKKRVELKSLDQIKDAKQVLFSCKYMSYAKTMFSHQQWSEAKPLGQELEITPQGDLSQLKVGDLLPVQVTFMGKPLSMGPGNMVFVTAQSNTFGGPDGFSLMSYLLNGRAQFRLPAAGQWLLGVYLMREVAKDPSLSALKGKTNMIVYQATLNLTVKP